MFPFDDAIMKTENTKTLGPLDLPKYDHVNPVMLYTQEKYIYYEVFYDISYISDATYIHNISS